MRATLRILAATMVAALAMVSLDPRESMPQSKTMDRIRQKLKERPDDPTLYYLLAVFQARQGDKAGSLESLKEVEKRGKGFLPPRGIGFEGIWDDPEFQAIRKRLEDREPRVVEATELFRLEKNLIPEGITYDPDTRAYYVGSIAGRKIVRFDSTRVVTDFSQPGELDHVLGLAIDSAHRRLYAVSTTALTEAGQEKPVNRIACYDLRTGKLERSFPVPQALQLNDVAVSPRGDLYTTDSWAGAVFRIRSDGLVDTLAAPGAAPGANGLAVSPDGSTLYLAHSTGIARFDLDAGTSLPLIEIPPGETVAAIDGLYLDGSDLIGIQNVTSPGRVIRMKLRKDGRSIESVETLLSHHHEALDEPTTGVIVGRSFSFLATTQVARFTPKGVIDSPETVKAPVVLSVDLERTVK